MSKRRKKKHQKDMIVRGESERGDFLLDLTYYIQAYVKANGVHPLDGLDEDRRKIFMEAMMIMVQQKDLNPRDDAREYKLLFDTVKEGVVTLKDMSPSARDKFLKGMLLSTISDSIFRLPGPQTGKTPKFSKGQQLVVELYHRTLLLLRQGHILHDKRSKVPVQAITDHHNRLWSLVNESRIIQIPTELYERLRAAAAQMVSNHAGIRVEDRVVNPPEDVRKRYLEALKRLTATAEMPEHMPFDKLYFALDRPLEMDLDEAEGYGFSVPVWVFAFVVTRDEVYVMVIVEETKYRSALSVIPVRAKAEVLLAYYEAPPSDNWLGIRENRWGVLGSLLQFVVPWFVEWVNSHQTLITEKTHSFSYRSTFKKRASEFKMKRPIPPPYYTVYIKDTCLVEFMDRKSSLPFSRQCPQHRYDVRGTWVCRVARGSLPLDPKLEKQLRRDKRRKIFTTEKPDSETVHHLLSRGIPPKRVDEWLAVLVYWRSDHQRGPEDGPYIPSIRKSARKEENPNGVDNERRAVGL